MIKLGISLYPEQETIEEITSYINLAAHYGFTHIFTSMFSVPGKVEDVKTLFKQLCSLAHDRKMKVCIDANASMLEKYGACPDDLSVFKEIGVDEIRMDMCYGDERDQVLVNNPQNILIQFSAAMIDITMPVIEHLKDNSKVVMCHNFYPQRYTGVSISDFLYINQIWKKAGCNIAAFISSNQSEAHGPWPVKNGLPTLEKHRSMPINVQVRELVAMDVDTIYFGNAFASEAELKEASEAVYQDSEQNDKIKKMMQKLIPNLGNKQIKLKISIEENLSPAEKDILLHYKKHFDFGDSNEFMLRSRITRSIYRDISIPQRACKKEMFSKGDVLIVNDNLKYYCGELQICRKDMENDGQRNLLGHLSEQEYALTELIKPGDYFSFIE